MKFFKDILAHWQKDWRENRWLFWIELVGCTLSATSTTIINVKASHPPMLLCTTLWLFGSGLIMLGCYLRKAAWMQTLMAYYTLMNIVGLTVLVLR